MTAAPQFGDVTGFLAVIAAVFAELAVGGDVAGASRMRAFLIHRVLLVRVVP
jgi:hypothetical protein